jgi:hypothetical protein
MDLAGRNGGPVQQKEATMKSPRAKKVFGAVLAAVTLTMVTSVAPASAAEGHGRNGGVSTMRVDTGWDIP